MYVGSQNNHRVHALALVRETRCTRWVRGVVPGLSGFKVVGLLVRGTKIVSFIVHGIISFPCAALQCCLEAVYGNCYLNSAIKCDSSLVVDSMNGQNI